MAIGWTVDVLDTGGSRQAHAEPRSVPVPTRADFARAFLRTRSQCVLVTASDSRTLGYPLLTVLLARVRRQHIVVNVLSGRFAEDVSVWPPLARSCRRLTLRLADGVLACNRELARAVIKLGVPRSRLYSAGCFLPHTREDRDEELRPPADDFVAGHTPLLIAVGSLRSLYRLPLVVRAVGRLVEAYPSIGLILVTSGCSENAEKDEVRAAIDEVGQARVTVLQEVGHSSLLALMKFCDVYLRLTTHDGDSVSLHEALCGGLRCVATDTGNRPNGVILVRSPTPNGVSEAVRAALRRAVPHERAADREAENNMRGIIGSLCGGGA